MDHGSDAWSVLWLNEGGPVRSTVGTRRRRVFTTSWVVCAGSSTMMRSPSTTTAHQGQHRTGGGACNVVVVGGAVRSTRGTRRRRVFTTSWVVCAGSSTTARSPSATARWESPPKFSSPRCLIYNNLPVSCLILPGWAKKVRPQTHGHNSVQS